MSARSAFTSIYSDVGTHRIHAKVSVAGRPHRILLIHGVIVSHRYLMPLAEELAASDFDVYVPDLPGHGLSSKQPNALAIHERADVLAAWLYANSVPKPVIVFGNSYGCQIATELAIRHPDAVDWLVFAGPTVDRHARNAAAQIWSLLIDVPLERPSVVGVVLRDLTDMGIRRATQSTAIMLRDRLEAKLPHVPHRTLVVRGERDPIVSMQWAEEVTALLPQATFKVIPAAGHDLNYSAPVQLRMLIQRELPSASIG